MVGQVGARFLAESEIWLAGAPVRAAERKAAITAEGGESRAWGLLVAVAPLAETAAAHMTELARGRFVTWWRSLPKGAANGDR